MNEKRCAWCGQNMTDHQKTRTFCSKFCQKLFENWCLNRADSRAEALHRWRDLPLPTVPTGSWHPQ